MKPVIIYSFVFLLVFLLVSAGIIQLNGMYNNIFQLDFTPKASAINNADDSVAAADSIKQIPEFSEEGSAESTFDSETFEADSLKEFKPPVEMVEKPVEVKQPEIKEKEENKSSLPLQVAENNSVEKQDTSYTNWMKKTAGLFESMDSKKAAKIIEKYSDNIARDIIYLMKKKKAAEILAELNPETASRLTRMP